MSAIAASPLEERNSEPPPVLFSKIPLQKRNPPSEKLIKGKTESQKRSTKGSRPQNTGPYRYKIYSGNNCRLIMAAMRKRPWWHPLGENQTSDKDTDEPGVTISFLWEMYRNPSRYKNPSYVNTLYNHLEGNSCLVTKKGLYETLKKHCTEKNIDMLRIVPRTFYLCPAGGGSEDDMQEWLKFNQQFEQQRQLQLQQAAPKNKPSAQPAAAKPVEQVAQPQEASTSGESAEQPNSPKPEDSHGAVGSPAEQGAVPADEPKAEPASSSETLAAALNAAKKPEADVVISSTPVPATSKAKGASTKASNSSNSATSPRKARGTANAAVAATALPVPAPASSSSAGTTPHPPQETSATAKEDGPPPPSPECVWILKPASKTNRGFGIKVVRGVNGVLEVVNTVAPGTPEDDSGNSGVMTANIQTVLNRRPKPTVSSLERAASKRAAQNGWIVQQYMENPLLVSGRKFDIRCYVVIAHTQKQGLKAYYYNDCYIRTSCKKYNLSKLEDRETHLTNDAVQKYSKNYGKFESANKLSLTEWQQSINTDYPGTSPTIVTKEIIPKIKQLVTLSIAAAKSTLEDTTFTKSFELLGYDFMITDDFEPQLIEINSNPCLELCCPLLAELIPNLIYNVISLCVDPHFQPQPTGGLGSGVSSKENSSHGSSHGSGSTGSGYTKATEEAMRVLEEEPNNFELLNV